MRVIMFYVVEFFFYSAAGWLIESLYCSIGEGRIINRGFLTGPMCPIYGTASLVLTLALYNPFYDRPLLALLTALAPLPLLHLSGVFGLIFNIKSPYLDWANEAVAVKQSMSVLFTMLSMMGVTFFASGFGFALAIFAAPEIAVLVMLAVCLTADLLFTLLLSKWGVRKFDTL